jgi:type IV fimbrial biogenesis protein FimT
MMVTLAVAIVLLGVGVPLFQSMVANNRAVTTSNGLVTALQLARSEAVKRARNVTVCPVVDASTTPPVCGTAAQWGNGWTVYWDDGNTMEEHIRVWDMSEVGPTITTTAASVVFVSTGEVLAASAFQLEQPGTTGSQTRCVRAAVAGQIRMESGACP